MKEAKGQERCASCGCVLTKDREDELCGNCWNQREMGNLDTYERYKAAEKAMAADAEGAQDE